MISNPRKFHKIPSQIHRSFINPTSNRVFWTSTRWSTQICIMFPPNDLGSGSCTPFIIYIPYNIAAILVIKMNSLKETYIPKQKLAWPCWCIRWFHTVIASYLVSSVHWSCKVQYYLYHNMGIGTMWHCALLSSTPSQSNTLVLGCALFWCCAHVAISLIEFYFTMIFIMIIIGILMAIHYFLDYTLGFL